MSLKIQVDFSCFLSSWLLTSTFGLGFKEIHVVDDSTNKVKGRPFSAIR